MKRFFIAISLLSTIGCGGASEAPLVELPVEISNSGLQPVTNDMGYEITITAFRSAIRDIQLSVGGSTSTGDGLVVGPGAPGAGGDVPPLFHPGHAQAGEITGELLGDFIVDWTADGAQLGMAALIAGDYDSLSFTFRRASESDGLDPSDPLIGHTFHIEGTADDGSGALPFQAVLDVVEDTQMVGAPFTATIAADSTSILELQALSLDPFEDETLFDGVDFALLPVLDDGSGSTQLRIEPGQTQHNVLRRTAQTHDHYFATAR